MKNPGLLLKNSDLLVKNPGLLLKNVDIMIKTGVDLEQWLQMKGHCDHGGAGVRFILKNLHFIF